jgi:hypothetical protein
VVSDAADEWWIIGSTAVALHGANVSPIRDVDLLMSASDADQLLKRVSGRRRAGKPSTQFRSDVFGIWDAPPLPVEIMGGFSHYTPEGWNPIELATREHRSIDGCELFVPSLPELRAMLLSFGRPKDLERARLLT